MRIFKWRLFEKPPAPPPPPPPPSLLDGMHDAFAGLGLLITVLGIAYLAYVLAMKVLPTISNFATCLIRGLSDDAAAGPPQPSEQSLELASKAVRTSRIAVAPPIGHEAAYAPLCRALSAQGYQVQLWLLGEAEPEADGGGGPLHGLTVRSIKVPLGAKARAADAEMSAAIAEGSTARHSSALERRLSAHAPGVCSQFYALADAFHPDVLVCQWLLTGSSYSLYL